MTDPGLRDESASTHSAEDLFDEIPPNIDTEVYSVARLYDFLLGGRHNFAADRALGRQLLAAEPNGRLILLENRAFLARTVKYLLDQGVRQFLDLGSGIPTQGYVHEIAHLTHPGVGIVYIDNDPPAVSHSNYILRENADAGAVLADLCEPERVLGDPTVKGLIDFDQPVALLALAVLHFVPDEGDPCGIVARYRDHLAPGSFFVMTHATSDGITQETVANVQEIYQSNMTTATARTKDEIAGMFSGFDLVDPGIVLIPYWRPEPGEMPEDPDSYWFYGAVGRLSTS
jgi:hypothetical protein